MSAVESTTRTFDVVLERDAELVQHAARVGDGTRPVRDALVPIRRRAEQRSRVAGAECADDQVMDVVGVLERDHDRRLTGIQIELERSIARVAKQALLECLVDPGPRDDLRAVGGRS